MADAEMFGGGFVLGAHVHYTCREGYKMQGQDSLTCGEKGKWVGETPVCKGMLNFIVCLFVCFLSCVTIKFSFQKRLEVFKEVH